MSDFYLLMSDFLGSFSTPPTPLKIGHHLCTFPKEKTIFRHYQLRKVLETMKLWLGILIILFLLAIEAVSKYGANLMVSKLYFSLLNLSINS